MENTRQVLKPYKGYKIRKINGHTYHGEKPGQNMVLVDTTLENLKKHIRNFEKKVF